LFIIILSIMRQYYDLSFVARPGWGRVTSLRIQGNEILGTTGHDLVDAKRWPNAPHVAFANLDLLNLETLKMFTRVYGPATSDMTKIPGLGKPFKVDRDMVGYMRERVRRAWSERDAKRLWLFDNVEFYDLLPLTLAGKTLQLAPADVFTYLRLLLTRDISEGRARICKNPDCPNPYFITRRRDQKFCEWKCANLITQRKYQERKRQKRRRAK
jgi:hypothetical protein